MKQSSPYFIDRYTGGERAVLVHIDFPDTFSDSLSEFKELVSGAGATILVVIRGRRTRPESKYFVGLGKAEEIRQAVEELGAELVVFNHELSPAQERNLEKLVQCRVVDRTGLILDIFAQRARTFEGKLQVELAQLKHLSTRLVRGWTHLERQRGGIGLRGPGETQLETDRRLVGSRIKMIHKRLNKVISQRDQNQRARKRASIPTIAVVGYTNAGKSTLFNALTKAEAYTADQLFATLDPSFRRIVLAKLGHVILVDTVGFIRDLPHDLVAAFRATLAETRKADLLLHVVDSYAPGSSDRVKEVRKVLKGIGVGDDVFHLYVYNKIDLHENIKPRVDYDESGNPRRVWASALTGEGLQLVSQAIIECLAGDIMVCSVALGWDEGELRSKLYQLGVVKEEQMDAEGRMHLTLEIQPADYRRLLIRGN